MKRKLLTIAALASLSPILISGATTQETRTAPRTWEYCTSMPNSSGHVGVTHMFGSMRISLNDTYLMSYNCPPETWGVFVMGATPARLPFGDGFLCISPFDSPIYRLGPPEMSSFMGISVKHLDLTAFPTPGMCWAVGTPWYFQCYFRDREASGTGYNLSSGLGARFMD